MVCLCSSGLYQPHGEPQPAARPAAAQSSAARRRVTHGRRGPAPTGEGLPRGGGGRERCGITAAARRNPGMPEQETPFLGHGSSIKGVEEIPNMVGAVPDGEQWGRGFCSARTAPERSRRWRGAASAGAWGGGGLSSSEPSRAAVPVASGQI